MHLDNVKISGPTEVLKGTAISYNCELEDLELIFPPAELALEIIDGKNSSNQDIEVGGTFIPKYDHAPLSAKCYLRNSLSKKAFGVESDLIQTDVHSKKIGIIFCFEVLFTRFEAVEVGGSQSSEGS